MPRTNVILDNDLSDLSVADVLERLEAGKCGHSAVMRYLGIDSYNELVETMHFNGRMMPGHRDMIVTPETLDLIRQFSRPLTTKPTTSHV
jgi:hypothetical protein